MHPEFSRQIIADHVAELRHQARRARAGRRSRRHLRDLFARTAA